MISGVVAYAGMNLCDDNDYEEGMELTNKGILYWTNMQ